MTDKPSRRELMRPAQLLGLSFAAAVFAGVVTLVVMGFFQDHGPEQAMRALIAGLIAAGITFIVTAVVIALLLLAVDPADIQKRIDHPVLRDPDEQSAPHTGDDSGRTAD